MRRIVPPVALALALLTSTGGSAATPTVNVWTPHGPAGPQILALAASSDGPGVVYAASEDRIWKSEDSGDTWSATGDGPANLSFSLAADPADVDRVIAGSWDGALWATSDGGDHWATPSSGFSGSSWPLLSWTSAGLFALIDGALYASVDGGQHWTGVGTLPDGGARSLLVVSPTAIYVGSELGTVQFSDDGGATWVDRSSGLPTQIEPDWDYPPSIERLAGDPADPQILYAEASPLGVYRSVDGGGNWVEVPTPQPGYALNRVATLATSPTTVLAGVGVDVVRSTDGGASWTLASESPKSVGGGIESAFVGDPSSPTTVYVGGFGVYRSFDTADTFELSSEGLANTSVEALVAVPGASGSYLAGTWEGVFRTDDDAATWQHASQGMYGQALDIAADPTNSDSFYLIAAGDLWVTSDGAAHWQSANLTVAGVAYAVAADANHVFVGASTTIYRSADDGVSWTASALPLVNDIVRDVAIDPTDEARVYAGTTEGLFRSADAGATWTKIDPRYVSEITVAPNGVVYALAEGAVASFTSGGAVVPTASVGLSTYAYSLQSDPVDPDTAYAGTPQGVYKTADGGQHWVKLPTTGLQSQFVSAIVARSPSHLLVATSRGTASIDLSPLNASVEPAGNVTANTAELSGAANPNGSNASAFFEYGTTSAYGSTTPTTPVGSGTDDVPVVASLSGLSHATTYHYRLVVQTSNGIAASSDDTFTTDFVQPSASTSAATQLTATGARLNGTVNPQGGATTYRFEYGLDTSYGSQTDETAAGSGKAAVTVLADISGLDPGTTYHFRAVAENAKGTVFGGDRQLKTTNIPPTMNGVEPIRLRAGALEGGSIPISTSWSANPGTSPICDYQLQSGSDSEGGPYVIGLAPGPELLSGALPPVNGLYFGVSARGCDGTQSAFAETSRADIRMSEESAAAVSHSVRWTRLASPDSSGHRILRTTTPGSWMAFKFTGRSFALIAPKGVTYAAVSISVDGGPATRVPLYAGSRAVQNLVYLVNYPSTAKHRVLITARAAGDRRRVDVDAFAFIR